MKNRFLVTVFIISTLLSFTTLDKETYTAIVEDSFVEWAGSRPGKTHNGTLGISNGSFDFEDQKLVGGDFNLDMTTINVIDIPAGSKMNTKLVTHFNSSDFFDVENHPIGKFEITGSEANEGKTMIHGKLTIKGVTNEVSFLAQLTRTDDSLELTSEAFKIDRTKWDIKFRSGKFFDNLKNKLIYDDITISVKVKAKK